MLNTAIHVDQTKFLEYKYAIFCDHHYKGLFKVYLLHFVTMNERVTKFTHSIFYKFRYISGEPSMWHINLVATHLNVM